MSSAVPLINFKRLISKAVIILTYSRTSAIINCRAILVSLDSGSRASRTATRIKNCRLGKHRVAVVTTRSLSALVRAKAIRMPYQSQSICRELLRQFTSAVVWLIAHLTGSSLPSDSVRTRLMLIEVSCLVWAVAFCRAGLSYCRTSTRKLSKITQERLESPQAASTTILTFCRRCSRRI